MAVSCVFILCGRLTYTRTLNIFVSQQKQKEKNQNVSYL